MNNICMVDKCNNRCKTDFPFCEWHLRRLSFSEGSYY